MDTIVELRPMSVAMRRARTNSNAVDASSPRVELMTRISQCKEGCQGTYLSQALIKLLVANASLIDTLFFSPPLTPLIEASPTGVRLTCFSPKIVVYTSVMSRVYALLVWLSTRGCGARVLAANSTVCSTVSVGKWTSSSGQYWTSPR